MIAHSIDNVCTRDWKCIYKNENQPKTKEINKQNKTKKDNPDLPLLSYICDFMKLFITAESV